MPKPNPLTHGLEQQPPFRRSKPDPAPPRPRSRRNAPAPVAPSRMGRVLVGGHFAPAVQRTLKIIAAEEGTTVQALLAEGINTVFARRQKPEIAGLALERP